MRNYLRLAAATIVLSLSSTTNLNAGSTIPAVPSTVPIVVPWPQSYDFESMDYSSPSETSGYTIYSDGLDSIGESQVRGELGNLFSGIGTDAINVHIINPENILANPSFENHSLDDIDDWSEEWISVLNQHDSSLTVSGSGSAKLLARTTSPYITRLHQDFDVEPNTDYAFEVFMKLDSVGSGAYVEVWNVDEFGGLHNYQAVSPLNGTVPWTIMRGSFDSGSYPKARIYMRLHGSTGTAWFDAARVFRLDDPSSNLAGIDENLPLELENIPASIITDYDRYRRGLVPWQQDDLYYLYGKYGSSVTDYYVVSSGERGRFYGVQTLNQLLNQTSPVGGTVDLPYDFHILDYPDYPTRSFTNDDGYQSVFVDAVENANLSTDGKKRIDYLANLKLSELIMGAYLHDVGYNQSRTESDRLFSWNPTTRIYEEKNTIKSNQYWDQYSEITDYLRERYIEPMINQPFLWYANFANYDRGSFPEGIFCNQIPFTIGSDNVARPVEFRPAVSATDNLITNGRFERALNISTVRNQSPVEGNNYRYVSAAFTTSSFSVPDYSELEVSMWAKTSESDGSIFSISNTSSTGSYTKRPNTVNWANVRLPVVSNGSGTMALSFDGAGTADSVDNIQVFQHNVVKNPGFEFYNTSSDAKEWLEDLSGGTVTLDTSIKKSGSRSLKINRASSSGFTRITQDFISTPNQVHTATIWTKHNSEVGAYCEVYEMEGGSIVGDSYVATRQTQPDNTDWYKHEFAFKTNDAGTFRLYLRLHGAGTVWYDDVEIRPEVPIRVFTEGFESTAHLPYGWTRSGTGTWSSVLTSDRSAEGLSALETTGLVTTNQYFTLGQRSDYRARALYDPDTLTSQVDLPKLKVEDNLGNLLDEVLDTPQHFEGSWRQFKKEFSSENNGSGEVIIDTNHTQIQLFDNIEIQKINWALNSSFEHTQTTNNFNDWDEEYAGVTRSTTAFTGNYSIQLSPSAPGQTLVRVSQDIIVEPHKDYHFEVMAKTTGASATYSEVYYVKSDGSLVWAEPTAVLTSLTDWTKLEAQFNSLNYTKVRVYVRQHGSSGTSWFDDFKLYPYSHIENGSFEESPSATWTGVPSAGVTQDSVEAQSGSYSLKISDSSGSTNVQRAFTQTHSVPPWTTVQLSFWVKTEDAQNVRIRGEISSAHSKDSPENGSWDYSNWLNKKLFPGRSTFDPPSTNDWTRYTLRYNTGRSDSLTMLLYVEPWNKITEREEGNWSGDIWFDSVELTPVPDHITDDSLEYNLDGDRIFVQSKDGAELSEGVDYDVVPASGIYEVRRRTGGSLSIEDEVYITWNDDPIIPSSCPQNSKVYLFAERLFESYHNRLGLRKFHVQHDDIGYINIDGRSLAAGLTDSQQLWDSLNRLKAVLPDDTELVTWADSSDRYHFAPTFGDFNNELLRSINNASSDILLMPWDYRVDDVANHAEAFRREAQERDLYWVGTAGTRSASSATSSHWMTNAEVNSRFLGVSWADYGVLFDETTSDIDEYDGLPLMLENTWNHNGYNDHPSESRVGDLLYDPTELNDSLGDLLTSRNP